MTKRRIEPAGLVSAGFRWYLVGWDLDRGDWRTFRVDRIAGTPARGETFAPRPPPPGGLSAYVEKSVAIDAYGVQARVRLYAPASDIAPRLSWYGRVESDGPQRCTVTAGAPSIEALAAWMSTLGVDFEILEPAGAGDALRALARRIARAARRPGR